MDYVEETVEKIIDNKNVLTFNYYTDYSNKNNILFQEKNSKLLEVLKKLKEKYPNKINSSIEHIEAIVTGTSWLGNLNYESCPSISYEHISNQENINNGKSHLPFFNTYKSDLKTIEFCCTSGHCDECRDSQAVYSWLLMGFKNSRQNEDSLNKWLSSSINYWNQFVWFRRDKPYLKNDILSKH